MCKIKVIFVCFLGLLLLFSACKNGKKQEQYSAFTAIVEDEDKNEAKIEAKIESCFGQKFYYPDNSPGILGRLQERANETIKKANIRNEKFIVIFFSDMALFLFKRKEGANSYCIEASYPISASAWGLGFSSYQTPPGLHRIVLKGGEGAGLYEIIKSKKKTGKFVSPDQRKEDYNSLRHITARILVLEGAEYLTKYRGWQSGQNHCYRGAYKRMIYIHGTPEEGMVGNKHRSRGCPMLLGRDMIDLYDRVRAGRLSGIRTIANYCCEGRESEKECKKLRKKYKKGISLPVFTGGTIVNIVQ